LPAAVALLRGRTAKAAWNKCGQGLRQLDTTAGGREHSAVL
jgi:hypothetical protein